MNASLAGTVEAGRVGNEFLPLTLDIEKRCMPDDYKTHVNSQWAVRTTVNNCLILGEVKEAAALWAELDSVEIRGEYLQKLHKGVSTAMVTCIAGRAGSAVEAAPSSLTSRSLVPNVDRNSGREEVPVRPAEPVADRNASVKNSQHVLTGTVHPVEVSPPVGRIDGRVTVVVTRVGAVALLVVLTGKRWLKRAVRPDNEQDMRLAGQPDVPSAGTERASLQRPGYTRGQQRRRPAQMPPAGAPISAKKGVSR